jgi:hypothetical protein
MVLTTGKEAKLIEQPVKVLIDDPNGPTTPPADAPKPDAPAK